MKPKTSILLLFGLMARVAVYGGTPHGGQSNTGCVRQFINHADWNFTENKGQLADKEIKYSGHQGGVYLYCRPGKISFVFTKSEQGSNNENVSEASGSPVETQCLGLHATQCLRHHVRRDACIAKRDASIASLQRCRTDLVLLHANANAQIIASEQQEYYENYYTTGNADSGITNVHTYKTITYKDIYPNIDMVIHARPNGMEYEFVVRPGGNADDIQMQWNGLQHIKLTDKGGMFYGLELGQLTESAPCTYTGSEKTESHFLLKNRTIGFKIGHYDKSKVLIIDPTLVWGTYYGWTEVETNAGIAADPSGNIYITGSTLSSARIATNGSYQTAFSGGSSFGDAYLAKFNRIGQILWATYYGGTAEEEATGITCDAFGNVFITGVTTSKSGIATSGAYQTSNFEGSRVDTYLYGDIYIAEFGGSGKIKWATYYGGTGADVSCGIAADKAGDVYITGQTYSASQIATAGTFLDTLHGGGQGFIAKFSGAGKMLWGTYYGCGASVYVYGLTTDGSNNVYITGCTYSTCGIATSGAYRTFASYYVLNSFLTKFSSNGKILWGTYYGGNINALNTTNYYNYGYGVTSDGKGSIYITGFTSAPSNGIATNGAYQTSNAGPFDAYLAKFDTSGALKWGTYYGGGGMDYGGSVAVDSFGNVYITGQTQSSTGIATGGAYRTYLIGSTDAYLADFDGNGNLQWATYYGLSDIYTLGLDTHPGYVAVDGLGNVYISGVTAGDSQIATSGAYQTANGGKNDVYIAKFGVKPTNDAGVSFIINPVDSFCSDSADVKVELKNYGLADLDSVTVNWSINGTIQNPRKLRLKLPSGSSTPVDLGYYAFAPNLYTIKSWTTKPNGQLDQGPDNDTSIRLVKVNAVPSANAGGNKSICIYGAVTIGVLDTISVKYSWTSIPGGFYSIIPTPRVDPISTTTYYLTETNSATGCKGIDSAIVVVNQLPRVNTGPNRSVCSGDSVTIGSGASKSYGYNWKSTQLGFGYSFSRLTFKATQSTLYYLTVFDSATGCSNMDSVEINVFQKPQADAGPDKEICKGATTEIGDSTLKSDNYIWSSLPIGFSSTSSYAMVSPLQTTSYILTVSDPGNGCSTNDTAIVRVDLLPVIASGQKNYQICNGRQVKIGSNGKPGISYQWSSNPPGFSSSSPNPVVGPDTTITEYFLTIKDLATGCTNIDFDTINVNVLLTPSANTGKDQSICMGQSIKIGADSVSGIQYLWESYPSGFNSSKSNPIISPITTTTYTLFAKNSIGCTNFDSVTITVNPKPKAFAGLAESICSGTAVQLGSASMPGQNYSWASNPYGFFSSISNPVDSPHVSTEYYLIQTIAATGCADTDSVRITVLPRPTALFGAQNINGFQYQFATLKPNYPAWQYHWDFGDAANGPADTASGYNASHIYTQNGKYPVTLTVSLPGYCTVTDTYTVVVDEQFALNIYPNAFDTKTNIAYTLTAPAHVSISVTDEIGRQIGVLFDGQLQQGEYNTAFDAAFWKTRPALYFVLFQVDGKLYVRKIVQTGSIYH